MSSYPPLLEVVEIRDAGRVRLRLRGELDLATAPLVAARLRELAARREPMLLDLDELTFIDASGIRLVVTAAQAAARDDWVFAITPGSDAVRRLFELVRLDGQLPIERKRGVGQLESAPLSNGRRTEGARPRPGRPAPDRQPACRSGASAQHDAPARPLTGA